MNSSLVPYTVALDQPDPATAITAHASEGVDRIIEVAFSDNVDLDAAVTKNHTVIAAYATRADRPDFPFWPMLFDNVTIRLLGSDDFPAAAKQQAQQLISPPRPGTVRYRSRSARHCPSSTQQRHTTVSTRGPVTASCSRSPTEFDQKCRAQTPWSTLEHPPADQDSDLALIGRAVHYR